MATTAHPHLPIYKGSTKVVRRFFTRGIINQSSCKFVDTKNFKTMPHDHYSVEGGVAKKQRLVNLDNAKHMTVFPAKEKKKLPQEKKPELSESDIKRFYNAPQPVAA